MSWTRKLWGNGILKFVGIVDPTNPDASVAMPLTGIAGDDGKEVLGAAGTTAYAGADVVADKPTLMGLIAGIWAYLKSLASLISSGALNVAIVRGDVEETLWTDDTSAYFVRHLNAGSVSWTDVSGNASSGPGAGARPAAGTSAVVDRSSYQATAGGTGYSIGDLLDHFVILDPTTGTIIGHFWINATTEAKLASAPSSANITPISPLPVGAAQDGTDGTGITPPAGGSGIRGWLSGLYKWATAGGEAHLGEIGGNIAKFQTTFGPSGSTPIAAGSILMPLTEVTGMGRVNGGTGLLLGATMELAVANSNQVDLVFFSSLPTGTYNTIGAAFALNAADRAKVSKGIKLTDWTSLGASDSLGEATPGPKFYKCDDATKPTSLWVVAVARGPITLAAVTDGVLTIRGGRN